MPEWNQELHPQTLKNQLQVLVEENAALAERAEDSLLLGLISETISNQQNTSDVISHCLEKISILKDIHYCSCGKINGNKIEEIESYISFSDSNSMGYPIEISNEKLEELQYGPVLINNFQNLKCSFDDSEFQPELAVLVPFETIDISGGVFLFLDDRKDKERFKTMLMLLNHVTDMVVSKYNNLLLFDALQVANSELEQRVIDRTRELTKAMQALKNSEKQQRDLLNNTSSVIYIKDLNGRYLFINRMYEELFHILNQDILGQTDHDIFSEKVADAIRQNDLKALQSESVLEFEEIIPHDDGDHTYISIKFCLKNASGKVYASCGISTDITDRLLAEQALHRSQKMDAIGQMAGGIAHDFNNILSIIIGNVSLLERQISNDENALKRIHSIKRASLRASDLTRQLLSVSRKSPSQLTITNINQVIEGMERLITRSITPEVMVEMNLASKLWNTKIDPGGLEDTLLNFIINARDAMPNGGKLKIESENCSLNTDFCKNNPEIIPGDYIQLTISDSGKGIPLMHQEQIFEPFFTTKPQGKGTGLGLAMVFGYIKRSGGCIKFSSELGIGTTFHIYLPRSHGEVELPLVTDAQVKKLPGGNEIILAVDDEKSLLELAHDILQELGYQVITANNAKEALDCLAAEPGIVLLFSDIVMPGGMNGFDLAEQATASYPGLKVLLTSGYSGKETVHIEQSRFSNNLLNKPYSPSELAHRLRQLLEETENH